MRGYYMRIAFGLLLIFSLASTATAKEIVSVELGVSAVHNRVIEIISDRYGLRPVETKNDEEQTTRSTAFLFAADPVLGTPQILATIGVQKLIAPGSEQGVFIAVSFGAVPRLQTNTIDSVRLMKFCNQWNLSPYPIRLAVVDGRLTSLSVIVLEPSVTLSSMQLQREFTRVLQSVPRILLELRRNGLI